MLEGYAGRWVGQIGDTAAIGLIVYRLGRYPFKVERRVRFPLRLLVQVQVQEMLGA